MSTPTPADIERLIAETECARELLRAKCEELKGAVDALRRDRGWTESQAVTLRKVLDRRKPEA